MLILKLFCKDGGSIYCDFCSDILSRFLVQTMGSKLLFDIIMFMPPQFLLGIFSKIVNKDRRKIQRSGKKIKMQLQMYIDSNVQHSGDATLLCASFNEKWCTAPQRPLYTSIVAFLYCIQIRFWILYGQAATMYVSEYLLFAKQADWVRKSKIFGWKHNILKGNHSILWIHQLTKIGHGFRK